MDQYLKSPFPFNVFGTCRDIDHIFIQTVYAIGGRTPAFDGELYLIQFLNTQCRKIVIQYGQIGIRVFLREPVRKIEQILFVFSADSFVLIDGVQSFFTIRIIPVTRNPAANTADNKSIISFQPSRSYNCAS